MDNGYHALRRSGTRGCGAVIRLADTTLLLVRYHFILNGLGAVPRRGNGAGRGKAEGQAPGSQRSPCSYPSDSLRQPLTAKSQPQLPFPTSEGMAALRASLRLSAYEVDRQKGGGGEPQASLAA